MKSKFTPMPDYVLVDPVINDNKTASGIEIAGNKGKPFMGYVKAVGKDIDKALKIKDKIMFVMFRPRDIELEGEKYLLVEQQDIYGKFL